jgi:hypothetical protein
MPSVLLRALKLYTTAAPLVPPFMPSQTLCFTITLHAALVTPEPIARF